MREKKIGRKEVSVIMWQKQGIGKEVPGEASG